MKITNKYFLLTILFILALLILPASGEILTGTLSAYGYNSSSYVITYNQQVQKPITGFYVNDIQYTGGTKALIRFDNGYKPTFNDSVSGRSVPFIGMWGNYTVCTGTIGYQRLWDSAFPIPNEINGYQYLIFDTWNYANYTGDLFITLNYDKVELGLNYLIYSWQYTALPSGKLAFGNDIITSVFTGSYLLNKDFTFLNTYAATKPAGLGIVGVVTKTIDNSSYGSQAFIINGTSPYNTLASQPTVTTDNLLFNVPATTIKICVLDGLQQWHNSTKLFSTGEAPPITPTITPTITPIPTTTLAPYDTWIMDIYPSAINLGDEAQLYIASTNSSRILDSKVILYYENNNLGAYSSFNLIGVYRWNSSTSNWDFRVNNTASYDYTPHDPQLLMVTPKTNGEYTYQVAIFGANSVSFGTATGNLLIGAQSGLTSTLTMLLSAHDQLTTSHLSNYQLQVTDYTGFTRFYDIEYDLELSLQRGGIYILGAVKEGYQSNAITFTVPVNQEIESGDFGAMVSIGLFPLEHIPTAGNTTIIIHVDDKETYYPLANVQISMSGVLTPKFTGSQGESVFFIKPQNTQFTVTAVKNGYCTVSETKNTSTQTTMYIPLFMKFGACAGVQPTHTPIPNATSIIPIPTLVGGYGNLTGNAGVCNTTTTNITWMQTTRNYIACAGIDDLLSQNLLIAVIIILIIGGLAASKAKAVGFAIGAVLGAIISMALGLIAFWIIVLLIILSVAILTLKIFFSQSGG